MKLKLRLGQDKKKQVAEELEKMGVTRTYYYRFKDYFGI